MNDTNWLDEYVEEYNQRVYQGQMSPRAKKILREMRLKEHEFWLREAVREDSHSPVGDWWGAREVSD